MISVSIIEDDKLIREALKDLINEAEGFECIVSYSDCESALENLSRKRPSVMLMDIELPGMSGIEESKGLSKDTPR